MVCQRETGRVLLLILFYFIYLTVGALIFSVIEKPKEEELKNALSQTLEAFLRTHQHCLTVDELNALLRTVLEAENSGVSALRSNDSTATNWNFGQSLFFAASAMTTIGYGNVTPLSEGGRLFCVGYALIGIVLTVIMFEIIVKRLLTSKLFACFQRLPLSPFRVQLLRVGLLCFTLIVVGFLVPSFVFCVLEPDWNFFDAFYYCFISLTTVGLGDYIPAENEIHENYRTIYKICTTMYLYVGLVLVLLNVKNIREVPELDLSKYFCSETASRAEWNRLHEDRCDEEQPLQPSVVVPRSYLSNSST